METITARLQADGRRADELHEQSRDVLVSAVRAGAGAGLTQREIAEAVGRSQPEISRLLRFRGTTELGRRLTARRREVIELTAALGIRNLRVFGSVARGTDREGSDVDLLANIPHDLGLFALSAIEDDLGRLVGSTVDLVSAASLREHLRDDVLREALPL
ncbi:hypothetical protein BH10ACT7_BH10ACT7_04060 [soil metagenome]